MADTIKTILVPATGNPTDSATLDAALTSARAFSAHIDVLHVRVDPLDVTVAADGLVASIIDQITREAEEREAAVAGYRDAVSPTSCIPTVYIDEIDGGPRR